MSLKVAVWQWAKVSLAARAQIWRRSPPWTNAGCLAYIATSRRSFWWKDIPGGSMASGGSLVGSWETVRLGKRGQLKMKGEWRNWGKLFRPYLDMQGYPFVSGPIN